jgi:alpha-glucosidase
LLKGKIAQYTVIARRSGEEWFVGAITNRAGRTIDLPTDFLQPGKYTIEYIEDGMNANSRAEDYKLVNRELNTGETLKLNLAPGGGWVARIELKK